MHVGCDKRKCLDGEEGAGPNGLNRRTHIHKGMSTDKNSSEIYPFCNFPELYVSFTLHELEGFLCGVSFKRTQDTLALQTTVI